MTLPTDYTRKIFVIEAASRACIIAFLIKGSKVRKFNHAFLPKGIPAMPSESARSAR